MRHAIGLNPDLAGPPALPPSACRPSSRRGGRRATCRKPSLATAADALGDTERVLDLLELGYRERDVRMSFLLLDWPQLRGQPRFEALLRRMQLKPRSLPDDHSEPGAA